MTDAVRRVSIFFPRPALSCIAFLLAMAAPSMLIGCFMALLDVADGRIPEAGRTILAFAGLALMFAPANLAIGAPIHAFLHHKGVLCERAYVRAGSVAALLATIATMVVLKNYAPVVFLSPLAGMISGWVFWRIRRPDRDPRQTGFP